MQSELLYTDFVVEVNLLDFQTLTDEALKKCICCLRGIKTFEIREQIEIFALLKEIIYRRTGLKLFDSQLAAAVSLMNGKIAELPTGEGKTLAAVIPAVIHAYQGINVHVLTFNDYLAERDFNTTKAIYEFCEIKVGYIKQEMEKTERKDMYNCDIVYVTAKEAGFDYLKNFLCTDKNEFINLKLQYVIVDEADSILIDEAKSPLVIACEYSRKYRQIKQVGEIVKSLKPEDVIICQTENQAYLTEQGIKRVEKLLNIRNLYQVENIEVLSIMNMALQAQFLLKRDVDYIIADNKIRIIDESTGRYTMSKKYPDLLHASVEVKEELPLSKNSMLYNIMTIQNFILRYQKLSGMTGTAKTSEKEFYLVYGLEVDVIQPHIPCVRIDHEPLMFPTKKEKYKTIIKTIRKAYEKGQPVLIGTQSVKESELLSCMLHEHKIPHYILNAKHNKEEASIIAEAGKPYSVTVSTNMAGRGVDIRLGGFHETRKKEVQNAGGLYVISTGLNRSIRIDHQLRGRAGRQGDKGESCFFVSFEDEILSDAGRSKGVIKKEIEAAQRRADGEDEDARYILAKYSYIVEHQRQIITNYRNEILLEKEQFDILYNNDPLYYERLVAQCGIRGLEIAEKQLALYYINLHWAEYLESMEYIRDGIHLMLIGGLNPIDEYQKMAIIAFDEIMNDIITDIINGLKTYEITENGIDMETAGLGNATTTWTYLIDESKSQFSSLPRLIKGMNNQLKGTLFTISSLYQSMKSKYDTLFKK